MNNPADLPSLITAAGIMTPDEMQEAHSAAVDAPAGWRKKDIDALCRDPYFLAGAALGHPTGAMRWEWDASQSQCFCNWANRVLTERFKVEVQLEADGGKEPERLWIRCGENEEVCNWRTINRARWMGAFCVMSNRILSGLGVQALELETGGFDTVVAFCRAEYVEALKEYLPVVE